MKLTGIIIFVLFISGIASAEQIQYSKAIESDQWLYEFYSKFLEKFTDEIKKASKGDSCESPLETLETLKAEIKFYETKGFKSNASIAIVPFLSFAESLGELCKANDELKLERGFAILKMRKAVSEMKTTIGEIEKIVYYNETRPLTFDVSRLKEVIAELEALLDFYQQNFPESELEGLWVFVSKTEPVLYEEIEIDVYSKNVTPLRLLIDGKIFEAKKMRYSFLELGKHFVYAEGLKGAEIVRSNVVEISVKKIPVYIQLKANSVFIGQSATVEGRINDYYGLNMDVPLNYENLKIHSKDGFFSFKVKRDYECAVKVEVVYEGNETHEWAKAETTIYFSRYPTWIKIFSEKDRFFYWEEAKFRIEASDYLPIKVYLNDEQIFSINSKSYEFNLSFKPGKYRIYAFFEGDELRRPAKSNELQIYVEEINILPLILVPVALILTITLLLRKSEKKFESEEKIEREMIDRKDEESENLELKDVSDVYSAIFRRLISKYNLSQSLTPRELLKRFEKESFAEKLSKITEMHEKFTYAMQSLDEVEMEKFFKLAKELMEEI